MAVGFDAQLYYAAPSGTSFATNGLTIGSGSNRALVVTTITADSSVTGLTITWNGAPLTLVSSTTVADATNTAYMKIYAILNPAVGNFSLAGSWTVATTPFVIGAVSYTGVDQTSVAVAFPHGNTAAGTSATASVTITSATGNAVVASFAAVATGPFLSTSGINIYIDNTTINPWVAASRNVGAATVSMTAPLTGSGTWVANGCEIVASTVSAGTTDRDQLNSQPQFFVSGQQVHCTYRFQMEAGSPNETGVFLSTLEVWHATADIPAGFTNGPAFILLGMLAEKLQLKLSYCPTNLNPSSGSRINLTPWTSTTDIVRGQYYNVELYFNVVNDTTGFLRLWVDGVQVVNYAGPVGYGPYRNYFDIGMYRSPSQASTQSARFTNFLLGATAAPVNTFGLIQNFNTVNGGTYTIDGLPVANDSMDNGHAKVLIDPYTMRFEVRSGDVWSSAGGSYTDGPSVERDELSWFNVLYNEGQITNWEGTITVLPGPIQASGSGFCGIVQLHASTNVSPTYSPISIQIDQTTDRFMVVLTEPAQSGNNYAYISPSPIVRGQPMDLKIKCKMGPTGNGTVFVTLNGNTIVNFSGRVGATSSTYYWKCGIYRSAATETILADFSHMHMYIG